MAPRGRNFDGCWTCRSRKVKCDLQKPVCARCTGARIACAGYDVKLGWLDPLTVQNGHLVAVGEGDEIAFQRRNIALVRFPRRMQYHTFRELNRVLDLVDLQVANSGVTGNGYARGPFGVYTVTGCDVAALEPAAKKPRTTPDAAPRPAPVHSSIFSKTDNAYVHYALLDLAKLTIMAIKGPRYAFNEQNMFHILYPKFFPNIDSDEWVADSMVLDRLFVRGDALTVQPLFQKVVAALLPRLFSFARVLWPHNGAETVLIPFLQLVMFEYICGTSDGWNEETLRRNTENASDMTPWRQHIKLAVVYLVLALSSGLLSEKPHERNSDLQFRMDTYLEMSIQLRKVSIGILNLHMDEYDSNGGDRDSVDYDTLLLVAILLQIQADSFFGVFENYTLLFAIGEYVVASKILQTASRDQTTAARYAAAVFDVQNVFFKSTQAIDLFNYAIGEDDELNYRDLQENYDLGGESDSDGDEVEEAGPSEGQGNPRNAKNSVGSAISITSDVSGGLQIARDTPMSFTVSFGQDGVETRGKSGFLPGASDRTAEDHEKKALETSTTEESLGNALRNTGGPTEGKTRTSQASNVFHGPSRSPNDFLEATYSSNTAQDRSYFTTPLGEGLRDSEDALLPSKRSKAMKSTSSDAVSKRPLVATTPRPSACGSPDAVRTMYGLPYALISLFDEVIHLANHRNIFRNRRVYPRNFPKLCADVEDKLLRWDVQTVWRLRDALGAFLLDFHEALYHSVRSFHCALMVYYKRLVKEESVDGSQSLIGECFGHMERALAAGVRPPFWALLVCGADIHAADTRGLRRQCVKLWEHPQMTKYNHWRSKQILYEVWQRQEMGEQPGFMDMVREWGIVLWLG